MKRLLIVGLIVVVFSWCLTPIEAKGRTKEEIYQEKLTQLKPKDTKGHYALGLWCVKNKLSKQAELQFKKVIELKPKHSGARKRLGHTKIKKQWLSPEEITAQGWVKHKGKWINKEEKDKIEREAKRQDAIKKLGVYKGVLDKPGADYENLPWEQARTKETDRFIVKTNLSVDALNDICFLLECAYLTWQDFFGFPEPKEKLKVLVMKNRVEFEKIHRDLLDVNPTPSSTGTFASKDIRRNKSHEDHLLTYYYRMPKKTTSNTLLHEGTHYALKLVERVCGLTVGPPIWLGEGLTTYFESGKVKGKKLVTNRINQIRLLGIKTVINNNTYIKLKDFINHSLLEYDFAICYPEGWSLVYFLINAKDVKYEQGFQAYIEAWKKKKIAMKCDGKDLWVQDKTAHIKLFEKCMGVPIDQLEKEWKEYILKLK